MTRRRRLRVVIAEDDPTLRDALSSLISNEPTFELVGAAPDATEAIKVAEATQPDVAVLDVRMPGGGGPVAARGIARRSPGTKVLALSAQGDRSAVIDMLEAGAVGYLVKGGPTDEITDAIKRAPSGKSSLSVDVTSGVIHELVYQLGAKSREAKKHKLYEQRTLRALNERDALRMDLQPIVTLGERTIVGAEALARFRGPPERTPSRWFSEAEVVGRRTQLELTAAHRAIELLPQMPAETFLTVNVSPKTLTKPSFQKLITGSDSSRLIVEITEHAPVPDYDHLASALGPLREQGMRLAVDDAGAGFASLRHILKLDPDLIKLDLTLIRNIQGDRGKQALAAGLISFAHTSGATIIAEGIEHEAEVETLVHLGVTHGQGYYLSRPGPLPLRISDA